MIEQFDAFCEAGDAPLAASYLLHDVQAQLRDQHVPRFWFAVSRAGLDEAGFDLEVVLAASLQEFCGAVAAQQQQLDGASLRLLTVLKQGGAFAPTPAVLRLRQQYSRAVAAHLQTAEPTSLHSLLTLVLEAKLAEFAEASPVQLSTEEDGEELPHAGADVADALGEQWLAPVHSIATSLQDLGLRAKFEDAAVGAACAAVQQRLATHAVGEHTRGVLADALHWADAVPLQFLRSALLAQVGPESRQRAEQLRSCVYDTIGRLRIGEMFDIVVDYPDSLPAVHDVRSCLVHTGARLQQHFVSRFRAAVNKRLLHAGAATTDIIGHYVSTIKTLREVDASGVLLEAVADPIRTYLRGRKDAIRCIVTMLTNDSAGDLAGGESLFEELNRTNAEPEDVSDAEMDDDEAALAAAEAWEPDPVNADPTRSSRTRRMSDIIAALVGIYGSKELFINEYRLMLADRLASKSDFDCQRELATMELLKLRFGEANLHGAEIMLGDVASSKRINASIHTAKPALARYKATIVSELFWPPFSGEPVQLPAEVTSVLETFGEEYSGLKAPRKLQWKSFLGSVVLVITAGGHQREMRVSMLHAAILLQFKEKSQWQLSDLAAAVSLPPLALHKALILWTSQGILRELPQPDGSTIVERVEDMQSAPTSAANNDEEVVSSVISAEEKEALEVETFGRYIIMMLTNFDGMPLERIHNMLKMFVQEPHTYDRTIEQLTSILSKLVAQETLSVSGGLYRIVRGE